MEDDIAPSDGRSGGESHGVVPLLKTEGREVRRSAGPEQHRVMEGKERVFPPGCETGSSDQRFTAQRHSFTPAAGRHTINLSTF